MDQNHTVKCYISDGQSRLELYCEILKITFKWVIVNVFCTVAFINIYSVVHTPDFNLCMVTNKMTLYDLNRHLKMGLVLSIN